MRVFRDSRSFSCSRRTFSWCSSCAVRPIPADAKDFDELFAKIKEIAKKVEPDCVVSL